MPMVSPTISNGSPFPQAFLPYPAIIYARVSSKDQADTGYSLDDQVEQCLTCARKEGDDIPEACIFKEDYTGMSLNRPEFTKIRAFVQQGQVRRLYFWDLDRLSRKLAHKLLVVEECETAGTALREVRLPTPQDNTPEDHMLSNIRSVFAEYEYHKIRERTERGRRARVKRGYPPGGRRSFGYVMIKHPLPDKGAHYEEAPEEAAIVRRIFDLYVRQGLSQHQIAALLTREGVPPPGGVRPTHNGTLPVRVWYQSTVHGILSNTAYIGTMNYGKKTRLAGKKNPDKKTRWRTVPQETWNPITVPALIDEATFEAAQVRMTVNAQRAKRNRKHDYLFVSGRLRCGQCQRSMSGERVGAGRTRYVCCRGKLPYHAVALPPHVKRSVPGHVIEPMIWGAVERALRDPALIAAALEGRRTTAQTDAAALDRDRQGYLRQLAQCDKDLKRWDAAYEAEAIDARDLKVKRAEIATRRASAEKELALLDEQDRLIEQAHLEIEAIEAYCAHVCEGLRVFDLSEKRRALEAFNITVIWHHDRLPDIRGSLPLDLYAYLAEGIGNNAAYYIVANHLLPFSLHVDG